MPTSVSVGAGDSDAQWMPTAAPMPGAKPCDRVRAGRADVDLERHHEARPGTAAVTHRGDRRVATFAVVADHWFSHRGGGGHESGGNC